MSSRFIRTAAGQAEIQARALKLSRPVRNLLLVINDSRTIDDWLVQVHGVTPEDVALLRAEGLIAEAGVAPVAKPAVGKPSSDLRESAGARAAPAPAPAPAAASPGEDADWRRTQEVIRHAGYNALYDALTSIGKAKLGLMRGYRFVLEVEKCNGPDEIRAFAMKFVEQLRAEHGMGAVGEFTYAVGAVKA